MKECKICGMQLTDQEIRACEADPRTPDDNYFCELHRRQFSACQAVRQVPGRTR